MKVVQKTLSSLSTALKEQIYENQPGESTDSQPPMNLRSGLEVILRRFGEIMAKIKLERIVQQKVVDLGFMMLLGVHLNLLKNRME